jgi:hypothetical protein
MLAAVTVAATSNERTGDAALEGARASEAKEATEAWLGDRISRF